MNVTLQLYLCCTASFQMIRLDIYTSPTTTPGVLTTISPVHSNNPFYIKSIGDVKEQNSSTPSPLVGFVPRTTAASCRKKLKERDIQTKVVIS